MLLSVISNSRWAKVGQSLLPTWRKPSLSKWTPAATLRVCCVAMILSLTLCSIRFLHSFPLIFSALSHSHIFHQAHEIVGPQRTALGLIVCHFHSHAICARSACLFVLLISSFHGHLALCGMSLFTSLWLSDTLLFLRQVIRGASIRTMECLQRVAQ